MGDIQPVLDLETSDGLAPLWAASSLSEAPLRSPSVFNFFPPNYQIPGTTLLGPEFDLQTTLVVAVLNALVAVPLYHILDKMKVTA